MAACGGAGDGDTNPNGLPCNHAYSVLGASTVNDNGNLVNLLEIKNPWSIDTWNGAYNDNVMSASVAQQLNHTNSSSDGVFYMTVSDFLSNFGTLYVGYFNQDYYSNYVDE